MFRISLFFLILLSLVACKPPEAKDSSSSSAPNSGPQIRIETDGDPVLGTTPIVVYVLQNGEGVSGAQIEITGDMTHAGMVPVIAQAVESEKGLYRADDFAFTMAGDWILTADIEMADGEKVRAEKSLTIVK